MKDGSPIQRWIFVAVAIWSCSHVSALGGMGDGVTESLDVRLSYAEAGDPSSQFNMGIHYISGQEAPRDMAKAAAWFRKAADRGMPEAQYNLALCYLQGDGMEKNATEAVKYLQAASVQGVFAAQKALIRCYASGLGVQRSPANALLWDFLARRTLELREGQPAGAPERPPKLRADGAAEWVNADGTRRAVHPDGSKETIAKDGTRKIERVTGVNTEVTADGTSVSTYANGVVERKLPDGTVIARDPKGVVQTTYPDGRKLLEGKATTQDGREVQLAQLFGKDGKLISSKFADGSRFQVTYPDGTFSFEYPGEDDKGGKVTVIEKHSSEGQLLEREVVREDGRKREGEEEWVIKRWMRTGPGMEVQVIERYGIGGSVLKQDVLKGTARPIRLASSTSKGTAEPASQASPGMKKPGATGEGGVAVMPVNQPTSEVGPIPQSIEVILPGRRLGASAQPLMKTKRSIQKELDELAEIARQFRGYVGASDSDYDRARTTAAAFTITLQGAPQKSPVASNLIAKRLAAAATPPPQPPLIEISGDRSDKYPLGLNGREALKTREWKHAETPHFVVHYAEVTDAQPVMRFIETAYFVVTQALGIDDRESRKKSHVFIFPNGAEWNAWLKKKELPSLVAGYAYKDELLVGAQGEKDDYAKVVCHEAAHAIVARYYPGRRWPLWLNEGFAEYMGARAMAVKRTHQVQRYLSTGADASMEIGQVVDRLTYGVPEGGFVGSNPLGNFYPNSEKLVRVLQEKLPAAEFPRFVNLLVAGNSFDVSLRTAYGNACADAAAFKKLVDQTK